MQQRGIAARVGSRSPSFVNVAAPQQPLPGEVLCKTLELGICGTDREILDSRHPLLPEGEDYLVLGHEVLARVEAVGEGVSQLGVGDVVVPTVRRPLGETSWRIDMLSFGTYVERGIVQQHGFSQPRWLDDPTFLYPIDAELAPVAVLTEPLAVAEKAASEALAVQRARLGEGVWNDPPPRVLVTGMGPIGFAGVLAARARGWSVTLLGRDQDDSYRAQLVKRLGARYVATHRFDSSPDKVERDGFDLILECTGNDEVLLAACGALASRGVAVWLGASRRPEPIAHNVSRLMRNTLVRNQIHIGSVNAAPRDFEDALAHLRQFQKSHPQELSALITTRVTPDGALWHFEQRTRQGIKVVVMYE